MPEPAAPAPAASAARSPQLVLAFDFGRRRIGVACGDTLSRSASALAGVANPPSGPWAAIDSLIREWRPALLVVGLPYNADGSESAMSESARAFAAELARRYTLPLRLIDERYSSLEAQSRLQGERAAGPAQAQGCEGRRRCGCGMCDFGALVFGGKLKSLNSSDVRARRPRARAGRSSIANVHAPTALGFQQSLGPTELFGSACRRP